MVRGHGPPRRGHRHVRGKLLVEHLLVILSLNCNIQEEALIEARATDDLDMVVEKVLTPEELRIPHNLCILD